MPNPLLYLLPPFWIDGLIRLIERAENHHTECGGEFIEVARGGEGSGMFTVVEHYRCNKCGATKKQTVNYSD